MLLHYKAILRPKAQCHGNYSAAPIAKQEICNYKDKLRQAAQCRSQYCKVNAVHKHITTIMHVLSPSNTRQFLIFLVGRILYRKQAGYKRVKPDKLRGITTFTPITSSKNTK